MSIHNYTGKSPLTLIRYRPENWKSFDNVLNEMVTVNCPGNSALCGTVCGRVRVRMWGCIVGGGTPLGNTSARRGGTSRWAEPGEGEHAANTVADTK